MKNLAHHSPRFIPTVFGLWLLAGLLACPSPATAQTTQYWDPGNTHASPGSGGVGTWNSANANWWTSGSSDVVWTSGNLAQFAGTVGTVTLGASATADGLTFTTAGYTLSGSSTLTLGGTTPTITVPASGTTTISCVLAGSAGFTVTGGTLLLSGTANTFTGGTMLSSGYLEINADLSLGATSSPLTLNSGTGGSSITGLRFNANNITLNANRGITLGANGGCVNAPSGDTETFAGVISGTGSFQCGANWQTGTGTNVLTAANTYHGATAVAAGRLKLGTGGSLPYGTSLTIGSDTGGGAFFDLGGNSQTVGPLTSNSGIGGTGSGTPTIVLSGPLTILQTNLSSTFGGQIIGSGSLTLNGNSSGTLNLSGANTYAGITTINGGVLQLTSDGNLGTAPSSAVANQLTLNAGSLRAAATFTLNANRGITVSGASGNIQVTTGNTLSYAGVITGAGNFQSGASFNTGTGTNLLSGPNTYSGTTVIAAGRLKLGASGALPYGTPLTIGADTASGAFFDLNGFSQTIGPLASSTGIGGGSGTGTPTIVLTGALTINESANSTFGGQIIGSSGSLTVNGPAALTLSGVNTYSGATTISSGELVGVTGGSCVSSPVTVSDGATNGVLVTDNTKQWACGSLAYISGAPALDFNFGYVVVPSTSLAPLSVNGDVVFNVTPTVTIEAGNLPAGTYPLMIWSGNQYGAAPATATLPPHVSGYLGVSGNTLNLYVSANTQPLRWTGAAGNSLWDINTSQNWKDSAGNPTDYLQTTLPGDAVVLDETYLTASPAITLNSTVTPESVTVSNSTHDYALSGTGGIAGSIGLTKQGTGTLTLGCANTYSGPTTIAGGTVSVGADNNLGAVPAAFTAASIVLSNAALSANTTFTLSANRGITMQANSTLDAASGQTLSYGGIIAGPSFNLTKTGPGTLHISQNQNTYSGITIISAGILQTGGDQSSGGKAANLGTTPSTPMANNITLAGGTLQGNNPNFAFMSNRGITLTANSGLSALTNCMMGIQGPIAGNYGLTMTCPVGTVGVNGVVYLEGTNTYTGNTIISSGVLALYYSGSISNSAAISIAAGAAFDVSAFTNGTFTLASGQQLVASGYGTTTNIGSATAAVLNGPANSAISLGSQPVTLNYTPASFSGDATHPSLYVPQGVLSLNGNSFTVNNAAGSPLGAGTYVLIQQARGNISSAGSYSVNVTGAGLGAGASASLAVSGGTLNLLVQSSAPAPLSITVPPAYDSGSGTFSVSYTGTADLTYTVHSATNAAGPWQVLGTVTADSNGRFEVTDTPNPPLPARFYWITYP